MNTASKDNEDLRKVLGMMVTLLSPQLGVGAHPNHSMRLPTSCKTCGKDTTHKNECCSVACYRTHQASEARAATPVTTNKKFSRGKRAKMKRKQV